MNAASLWNQPGGNETGAAQQKGELSAIFRRDPTRAGVEGHADGLVRLNQALRDTYFQYKLFQNQYPVVKPDMVVLHYFISDVEPRSMGRNNPILKHSFLADYFFDRFSNIQFRMNKSPPGSAALRADVPHHERIGIGVIHSYQAPQPAGIGPEIERLLGRQRKGPGPPAAGQHQDGRERKPWACAKHEGSIA